MVADVAPFSYLLLMEAGWRTAPLGIVQACSFAPPVIGITSAILLPVLRHRNMIPRRSAALPIGLTLAMVGILEPLFYWI